MNLEIRYVAGMGSGEIICFLEASHFSLDILYGKSSQKFITGCCLICIL